MKPDNEERRPQATDGAQGISSTPSLRDQLAGLVGGAVLVDVRRIDDRHELERTVHDIEILPADTDVDIVVRPGQLWPASLLRIRKTVAAKRLHVTIRGDFRTAAQWIDALRNGELAW